jgi:hypothetical protein
VSECEPRGYRSNASCEVRACAQSTAVAVRAFVRSEDTQIDSGGGKLHEEPWRRSSVKDGWRCRALDYCCTTSCTPSVAAAFLLTLAYSAVASSLLVCCCWSSASLRVSMSICGDTCMPYRALNHSSLYSFGCIILRHVGAPHQHSKGGCVGSNVP